MNPLARGYLNTAGCELPRETRMRADARVKYWNCCPGAYGHRRSSPGTPRSYVEDQARGDRCWPLREDT